MLGASRAGVARLNARRRAMRPEHSRPRRARYHPGCEGRVPAAVPQTYTAWCGSPDAQASDDEP